MRKLIDLPIRTLRRHLAQAVALHGENSATARAYRDAIRRKQRPGGNARLIESLARAAHIGAEGGDNGKT